MQHVVYVLFFFKFKFLIRDKPFSISLASSCLAYLIPVKVLDVLAICWDLLVLNLRKHSRRLCRVEISRSLGSESWRSMLYCSSSFIVSSSKTSKISTHRRGWFFLLLSFRHRGSWRLTPRIVLIVYQNHLIPYKLFCTSYFLDR